MKFKIEISAGGIVYKKEHEKRLWLVTQHSQHKGWGFPKGLVGDTIKNEPMDQAARREVQEEGGIKAQIVHNQPVTTHYSYRMQEYLVKKTVHYFLMKYVSGDPQDHDWEVSEAKFVSPGEALKILSFSQDKIHLKKAVEMYGQ